MKDEAIDTPRRIAFWAGIVGVILGWFLMQHLFAEQPDLGQATIFAISTLPPFALWGITLGLAQAFARKRKAE
ncbi:hypothetical protein [Zavarzinia sp.]|uniref:hypothetical protein n=1 Tax=Zavarzinia sp. TaxID=2027920 RepID=UPI003BB76757|nr:hypothetical protein [Zavarzinia sp.]